VTCGYVLRGLPTNGACPECGTVISRSQEGDRLAAADPTWLRTITRGQRLLAIGMVVAAIGIVAILVTAAGFVLLIAFWSEGPSILEDSFTTALRVLFLSIPIGMCLALVGVFFVTAQEGRDMGRELAWSERNLARWGMVGAVATCLTVFSIQFLRAPGMLWTSLELLFRSVFIVLLTVAAVALLRRLESLVRRIPDDQLAKRIGETRRRVRWAVPAAGIYVLILPVLGFGGGGMGGAMLVMAPFAILGFIAVIALILTAVRLAPAMRRSLKQFKRCLAESEGAA